MNMRPSHQLWLGRTSPLRSTLRGLLAITALPLVGRRVMTLPQEVLQNILLALV